MDPSEVVEEWQSRGRVERVGDDDVFVIDAPAEQEADAPPLLVLHGFPTASFDFSLVLARLNASRRVLLFDFPGYGLSAKPDRQYTLFGQADTVEALVAAHGIDELDLLSHDMGDSVAGELLARGLDGALGFRFRRRVLTNGSVYLDLAQLTDGQKFLAALPDESLSVDTAPDADALIAALNATMTRPDPEHVRAAAELIVRDTGNCLLPRIIRYLHERREHEQRWTGAIERHPAPLTIVWGDLDPIAVWPMTDRLLERRPDANRARLEGIGHYPMIEAPDAFADAVLGAL
jgi:pimeloyl-ACP methyl ester carboxylesterase